VEQQERVLGCLAVVMVLRQTIDRVSSCAEWEGVFCRIVTAAILTLILYGTNACGPPKAHEDTMPKRDINAVMEAHTSELMAIPGVAGVAIGALDDGTPCILVLVVKESDELARKIPKILEGHSVRIFESGEIRPMDNK
jgi:hypothetical protein